MTKEEIFKLLFGVMLLSFSLQPSDLLKDLGKTAGRQIRQCTSFLRQTVERLRKVFRALHKGLRCVKNELKPPKQQIKEPELPRIMTVMKDIYTNPH